MTASFILADLGIANRPRAEHAAYLSTWLDVLKDDPRAIFAAAGKAQQAADWMHAQQPVADAAAAHGAAGSSPFTERMPLADDERLAAQ